MDSSRTMDTLCLIVREITVNSIHGRQDAKLSISSYTDRSNSNKVNENQYKASYSNTNQQSSRLGTVALPKVIDYVEDSSQDGSGSDIPSQSSESSDDEQAITLCALCINNVNVWNFYCLIDCRRRCRRTVATDAAFNGFLWIKHSDASGFLPISGQRCWESEKRWGKQVAQLQQSRFCGRVTHEHGWQACQGTVLFTCAFANVMTWHLQFSVRLWKIWTPVTRATRCACPTVTSCPPATPPVSASKSVSDI